MTDANQEYSLGGFGARLKAAREAMNLSQKDAALRLHLSPTILEILETENFQHAPPVTFIRGYFRSYARLLNFNEEDINAALTQSGLETQPTTLVVTPMQAESMQMSDRHVQRISTVVIIGLFIFTGIWWAFHSSGNNSTQTRPVTVVSQQPVQTAPSNATVATTSVAPTTAPIQTAAPIVQAQPIAPTTAAPVTAATQPTTSPAQTAQTPAPVAATNTDATQTTPAVAAGTTPTTVTPGLPAVTPFTAPPADTTVANNEDSHKKHNRHRRQDSTVSGMTMALPEPGL